jgi:molybdenum cofactor cytidylyltransferase
VVLLADMPEITPAMIDRLFEAFDPGAGHLIVVPTLAGKRGNPVLWSARFFRDLMAVRGDAGGRQLLEANANAIVEVELGPAAGRDVDTPADLAAIGGRLGDDL